MTPIKNIVVKWLANNCSCVPKQNSQESTYEISMYIERKQQFENIMRSITTGSPMASSKRSLRKKITLNNLHESIPMVTKKTSIKNILYSHKEIGIFNQSFGITNVDHLQSLLPTSRSPSMNVSSIQSHPNQLLKQPNLHSHTSNHTYVPASSHVSAFPENLKSFYVEEKSISKQIEHATVHQITSNTSNPQIANNPNKKIDSLFKLKEIQSLVGQSQKNHTDISQVIYYTDHKKNANNINICFTESRNESEFENPKNQMQVSNKQMHHNRSKSQFFNLMDKVSQQSL